MDNQIFNDNDEVIILTWNRLLSQINERLQKIFIEDQNQQGRCMDDLKIFTSMKKTKILFFFTNIFTGKLARDSVHLSRQAGQDSLPF